MSKKDKFSHLLKNKNSTNSDNDKHLSQAHNSLFSKADKINNEIAEEKFEDTHKRQTYYISLDIIDELNRRAGRKKGAKTRIVNNALREYLDRMN